MKAFISYSWDNDDHKEWVRRFVDELIRNGIEVTLDQYDLTIGTDRFKFMEDSVRNADVVLCVCTPEYVERANERERGVGVETSLITPRFYEKHKDKQFIPIVRRTKDGIPTTPDYMTALIYVDFQNASRFAVQMEDLLRHLHKQPKHVKPPIGAVPKFKSATTPTAAPGTSSGASSIDIILEQIHRSRKDDWKYFDERGLFVLNANPDITIHRRESDSDLDEFHEDWANGFPDPVAYRAIHEIKYRDTLIHEVVLVAVDGYRMYLPLPKSPMELQITQSQYSFARLVNQFNPYGNRFDEYLGRAGITVA